MVAKQMLDEGKLDEAIAQLGAELRKQPNDRECRTFLFELLCFSGDYDRAGRQLDAIGQIDGDPMAMVGVQVYRNLLDAEKNRARLFAEGLRPRFMLAPTEAALMSLEALELARRGRADEARALLVRAEAARPARPGTSNGIAFDDLRDADDILAPVLEVFAPAGYCWVPWEQIQFVEIPPPTTLRDLLWAPAKLASFDGQLGEVFLPNLYPGTYTHPDTAVRLGRSTEWTEEAEGIVRGVGQKLFLVGEEARTLFELREAQFPPPEDRP